MGKAVCSQTPSSSAIPCSRTSLVTVFLGLLDLQGGEFKERLKKKVKELRKMQREVIKLCILSLSCTKEEQKDSQAYKTKKKPKKQPKPNKNQTNRKRAETVAHWNPWLGKNLVDQKDELPGHSWCGERTVLEEKLAGRSPGEHPRGTLCNMELQSSGWILSQGTKTVVIKYSSTLLYWWIYYYAIFYSLILLLFLRLHLGKSRYFYLFFIHLCLRVAAVESTTLISPSDCSHAAVTFVCLSLS